MRTVCTWYRLTLPRRSPELLSVVRKHAGDEIAGICSSSEYFVETAAELARACQLPGPDPLAIRRCRNKWEQRKQLQRWGLGMPAFVRVQSMDEVHGALRTMAMPVVLKPVVGTGSVGVRLCRNHQEVEKHAVVLLARNANERGISVVPEILVEEYIDAPEFSAETFGRAVVGITRKHVSPAPFFVETGHDFPVRFETVVLEQLNDFALQCLDALQLGWGPAHIEFRFDGQRIVVMEVNPRLAGGFIPKMIRLATGIDVIQATLALATGSLPDLTFIASGNASIRFLCIQRAGCIAAVSGLDEAARSPNVVEVELYKRNGDCVAVEHDFRDRIGHVISFAPFESAAADAAEKARNAIGIHIEDVVAPGRLTASAEATF